MLRTMKTNKAEMPRKEKRILPGIIVIAFAASAITFLLLLNMEKNILSNYEKINVWVAAANIQESVEITKDNLEEYFEKKDIDKNIVPEYAVTDIHLLEGFQTTVMIPKSAVLLEVMFASKDPYVEQLSDPVVVGCKADDLYQVASGILRQGDVVNVYTVNDELGETYLLWENVVIYQTFDSAGKKIAPEDDDLAATRINLIIEKHDTEQFYTELNKGSLRVVKVWDL